VATVDEILAFWLDGVGPAGWYGQDEALDAEIRTRFRGAWDRACDGGLGLWLTHPTGTLAFLILTDQFPRNMFRGEPEAFALDHLARAAAKQAIAREWDLRIDPPARQFFYMPLVHSERIADQDHAVRVICDRLPDHGGATLLHARVHREIIRRFGRFPYRNTALGRAETAEEAGFAAEGGYGAVLRGLSAPAS